VVLSGTAEEVEEMNMDEKLSKASPEFLLSLAKESFGAYFPVPKWYEFFWTVGLVTGALLVQVKVEEHATVVFSVIFGPAIVPHSVLLPANNADEYVGPLLSGMLLPLTAKFVPTELPVVPSTPLTEVDGTLLEGTAWVACSWRIFFSSCSSLKTAYRRAIGLAA